mmetsp:Transcript_97129/g.243536  ORF Transcript_97129/g.243536 Transcript_97129/m.243536 type:complete len:279 (-) Transcript_97129:405-1241(-)
MGTHRDRLFQGVLVALNPPFQRQKSAHQVPARRRVCSWAGLCVQEVPKLEVAHSPCQPARILHRAAGKVQPGRASHMHHNLHGEATVHVVTLPQWLRPHVDPHGEARRGQQLPSGRRHELCGQPPRERLREPGLIYALKDPMRALACSVVSLQVNVELGDVGRVMVHREALHIYALRQQQLRPCGPPVAAGCPVLAATAVARGATTVGRQANEGGRGSARGERQRCDAARTQDRAEHRVAAPAVSALALDLQAHMHVPHRDFEPRKVIREELPEHFPL